MSAERETDRSPRFGCCRCGTPLDAGDGDRSPRRYIAGPWLRRRMASWPRSRAVVTSDIDTLRIGGDRGLPRRFEGIAWTMVGIGTAVILAGVAGAGLATRDGASDPAAAAANGGGAIAGVLARSGRGLASAAEWTTPHTRLAAAVVIVGLAILAVEAVRHPMGRFRIMPQCRLTARCPRCAASEASAVPGPAVSHGRVIGPLLRWIWTSGILRRDHGTASVGRRVRR